MLYDILFLYIFLPVFMGLYALLKPKARPLLIAAANLFFIAAADVRGLAVFGTVLLLAYFSGIIIYNARGNGKEKNSALRISLIAVNAVVNAAVFLMFSRSAALAPGVLSAVTVFGAAVVPLHAVSYLTDVYRGDCAAQTRLTSLAAYLAFFPSLGFGPVLKYKNFKNSFNAPKISIEKTADGIRCYTVGLAEYLLVGEPLQKIWQSLTETRYELIKGAPFWIGVVIFCVMFLTCVTGLLYMGRGAALMLGFPVKPCGDRRLFRKSVLEYVFGVNRPLALWFRDYVYLPIAKSRGAAFKAAALILSMLGLTAWYGLDAGWAIAAVMISAAAAAQKALGKKLSQTPNAVKRAASALFIFAVGTAVCAEDMTGGRGFFETAIPNAAGAQEDFLTYLISVCAPRLAAGLLISSGVIKSAVKRTGTNWYRAAMPITELVLLLLCTAVMVTG